MTGWWILIGGATCATGALLLLTLAGHEVRRVEVHLGTMERREQRAARRRKRRRAEALAAEALDASEPGGRTATKAGPRARREQDRVAAAGSAA